MHFEVQSVKYDQMNMYIWAYANQMSQLVGPQKIVHHVYLITPDGLRQIQADNGLIADTPQIRLALTPNVEEACKSAPCSISPGCITHF